MKPNKYLDLSWFKMKKIPTIQEFKNAFIQWLDILSNECSKIKVNDKTICMFHVFFLINTFLHSHFGAYLIDKIWRTIHFLYFVDSVLSDTWSFKYDFLKFSKDNSCRFSKIEHCRRHTKDKGPQQLCLLFGSVYFSQKF